MTTSLRPYQVEAVQKILNGFQSYDRELIVMATGTGKTRTFSDVIPSFPTSLVIAHRRELIDQAAECIESYTGITPGIEMAGQRAHGERVIVGSVQTLLKRDIGPRDLVIIDEAHHAVSESYQTVLARYSRGGIHGTGRVVKVLGVTATPDRTDGVALGEYFQKCVFRYETKQAIRDGWLVPIQPLAISGIENLLTATKGRQTIIFTPNVGDAASAAGLLPKATYVHGNMPKKERKDKLDRFKSGEFQYIANCNILTEGFDHPATAAVATLRPTESRSLNMQMLGRGLRLSPFKGDCLHIDLTMKLPDHDLEAPGNPLAGRETGKKKPQDVIDKLVNWLWF